MKIKLITKFRESLRQAWYKQNFIVIMIALFLISSLSIGYSILSQTLNISGEVVLRVEKDIRVTSIFSNSSNCGYDIYNPKYNENSITVNFSLPSLECTIMYSVTVSNNGTKAMELISIINENYNNNNIIYDITGYNIGDVILPNNSITFTILFKYSPTLVILPDNTDLGATIKFVWQEYIDSEEIIDYKDFVYTGECEEYTIPKTGLYVLEVWGAQGGIGGNASNVQNIPGGMGGYSNGTVSLNKGEKIYVCVGGQGNSAKGTQTAEGGFNGGGSIPINTTSSSSSSYHGSGGGATDIRIGSNALYSRIIVAGGGGGSGGAGNAGYAMPGAYGGGATGGKSADTNGRTSGYGGTQTVGGIYGCYETGVGCGTSGIFGIGGTPGINSSNSWSSGGGGGGWYGGGGGGAGGPAGGGGSGFVLTAPTSVNVPSGYILGSQYYLSDAQTISGNSSMPTYDKTSTIVGNSGNGHAKITYINIELELNGNEEVTIVAGNTYVELGATLTINGVNKSSSIVKSGSVDTNTPGVYTITYSYTEPITSKIFSIKRKVTVIQEIIKTFAYTGNVQSYVIPISGNYKLEVWGAQGGNAPNGKGGYSKGTVYLTAGTELYIYVGGTGSATSNTGQVRPGGFNGGGGLSSNTAAQRTTGGGGTDIRVNTDSLFARIIVAGGGSGTASTGTGGSAGGGLIGIGAGGTQISAGDGVGSTGSGATPAGFGYGAIANSTGGGGGGWYGGGANGGGSGWIYTASTYSTWLAGNPTDANGWLLNNSYYLINAETIAGNLSFSSPTGELETGHSGNGYAKIIYIP